MKAEAVAGHKELLEFYVVQIHFMRHFLIHCQYSYVANETIPGFILFGVNNTALSQNTLIRRKLTERSKILCSKSLAFCLW